jgi:DDE superfamily endonuclease
MFIPEGVIFHEPYCDTKMINLFLKQLSDEFAQYFIVMQVDRASWHKSRDLNVLENIRLIVQTPGSPEFNPVEHVWEDIREKLFYSQAFETLDDVVETLCTGLKGLMSLPAQVKSMANFPPLENYCLERELVSIPLGFGQFKITHSRISSE